MDVVWTPSGVYRRASYAGEADLEASILHVQTALFGPNRIYIDVKKRIGGKNGPHNIPDGYLVDLTGQRPYLYVVENELAAHDPFRHIAVQILQFSLSFEEAPRAVKTILFNALQAQTDAKQQCKHYAAAHGFRNLDHMLEWLVFEGTFAALVIIDEMPENLENVLLTRFKFGVEVLELARYENDRHERFYHFQPFLADVSADVAAVVAGDGTTPRGTLPRGGRYRGGSRTRGGCPRDVPGRAPMARGSHPRSDAPAHQIHRALPGGAGLGHHARRPRTVHRAVEAVIPGRTELL